MRAFHRLQLLSPIANRSLWLAMWAGCSGPPEASPASDRDQDGFSTSAGDCDDANAEVHPGAAERCNQRDDDCDGSVDEDDAVDAATWYLDLDDDGHGDPATGEAGCHSLGRSKSADDCDDANAGIHPGATEVCDGLDNDCDGEIDGNGSAQIPTWYPDEDGDGFGDSGAGVASCDGSSGDLADGSDCDDLDPTVHPDAEERCDLVDNDCDGAVDEDDSDLIAGELGTWHPDRDGDGAGDLHEATRACQAPPDFVVDGQDCDDSDALVGPDQPETCNGVDDDCDGLVDDEDPGMDPSGAVAWFLDLDRDGYGDEAGAILACDPGLGWVGIGGDCDDGRADTNPAATETCGGGDQDCDGLIDEEDDSLDPTSLRDWYADADADGYGDPTELLLACGIPSGASSNGLDCDDADATISPAQAERCDGVDNDCDGGVDDEGAVDASTWYPDADEDGYGDLRRSYTGCEAPSGFVAQSGDCDELDPTVHPGAVEICDAIDNDCDGRTDDHDTSVDYSSGFTFYLDNDGDGHGDSSFTSVRCEVPFGYAAEGEDCDVSDETVYPGAREICGDGVVNDCDGTEAAASASCGLGGLLGLGDATARLDGADADDGAGASLRFVGDLDGDGADDFVVGAPTADVTRTDEGRLYVVKGGLERAGSLGDLVTVWEGEASWDHAGCAVAAVGDLNGDGLTELLIGASGDDTRGLNAGAAYVVDGAATGIASLAEASAWLLGPNRSTYAGSAVSGAGDFDGDGINDIVVGGYGDDHIARDAGAAWLVSGSVTGISVLADGLLVIEGSGYSERLGASLASVGDANGDGIDDLLLGAYGRSGSTGAAFLVYGGISGVLSSKDADLVLSGEAKSDRAGVVVATAGDVDGDGLQDLLIGASLESSVAPEAGAAYLILGGATGARSLAEADLKITGVVAGDHAGEALSTAGDADHDGKPDLLIGAPGESEIESEAGAAYLVLSGQTGSLSLADAYARFTGEAAQDRAGQAVAGGGDLDGDGNDDLLVGAATDAPIGTDAGTVYLLMGAATGAY